MGTILRNRISNLYKNTHLISVNELLIAEVDRQSSALTHGFINKLTKGKINQSETMLNGSVFTLKTTQD